MKRFFKLALITFVLLATVLLATACSGENTPYDKNDALGYNVSVRFDANGGLFTTNTSIIMDSYKISDMPVNADGMVEIALLSPDNALRGNDACTATYNGYFLAGWYAVRTESSEGYTYADQWDFNSDTLKVDPNGTYTASEPVITLYAAWIPLFEINFYSRDNGESLGTYTFNPNLVEQISAPAWNESTGAIEMHQFPKKSGYTFAGAYYDAQGTQPVGESVQHTGSVNYETGTAEQASMDIYVDWLEGEWYHIYTAEQFLDNASVNGSYVLHADLDFADQIWPSSLMYGNFSGTIEGNGHTIRNVTLTQTNNQKLNAGLFGQLTDKAKISDLTFENITFHIKSGTRMAGTSYGLLAGTISSGAQLSGVSILGSTLQVDSGCYFGTNDYVIGLVCGTGNPDVVSQAQINTAAVGDKPESVAITVGDDGNTVTVQFQ